MLDRVLKSFMRVANVHVSFNTSIPLRTGFLFLAQANSGEWLERADAGGWDE